MRDGTGTVCGANLLGGVERWSVFRNTEWQAKWTAAHALTRAKLTPRTRAVLELPKTARRRGVSERMRLLTARAQAGS